MVHYFVFTEVISCWTHAFIRMCLLAFCSHTRECWTFYVLKMKSAFLIFLSAKFHLISASPAAPVVETQQKACFCVNLSFSWSDEFQVHLSSEPKWVLSPSEFLVHFVFWIHLELSSQPKRVLSSFMLWAQVSFESLLSSEPRGSCFALAVSLSEGFVSEFEWVGPTCHGMPRNAQCSRRWFYCKKCEKHSLNLPGK